MECRPRASRLRLSFFSLKTFNILYTRMYNILQHYSESDLTVIKFAVAIQ